jgi:hypothetical protein
MWDSRYASEAYIFGVEPNEFLRQHASFEILQELTTELHEGTAHDGPSAVVQLVARRL